MNFSRAVETALSRQTIKQHASLDAAARCLARLGDPQKSLRAVHVAGTNGKGSVSALLANTLSKAGFKTGLFISPHLVSIRERMQIDGVCVSEEGFARAIADVVAAEAGPLTFFELLTCAAFLHFAREKTDAAVIETGIGGRLDATSLLGNPAACVITSIAFDHAEMLGDTLAAIAAEKAGIIKRGAPCVCAGVPPEAARVIAEKAAAVAAPLYFMQQSDAFAVRRTDWEKGYAEIVSPSGETFRLGLLGETQAANAATTAKTLEILRGRGLPVTQENIRAGFETVNWPGRFQIIRRDERTLILDGSHNPEAARSFAATFAASPFADKAPVFIIGLMADKDYRAILAELAPLFKKVLVTRPASPRALDPRALADCAAQAAPDAEVEVHETLTDALAAARNAGVIVITGSFYLIGAALSALSATAKAVK